MGGLRRSFVGIVWVGESVPRRRVCAYIAHQVNDLGYILVACGGCGCRLYGPCRMHNLSLCCFMGVMDVCNVTTPYSDSRATVHDIPTYAM